MAVLHLDQTVPSDSPAPAADEGFKGQMGLLVFKIFFNFIFKERTVQY